MSYRKESRVVAIIPARIASERFPQKVLAPLAGKPLVWHVFDRASRAGLVDEVLVATDDESVADTMRELNVPVVMTRRDHPSGTDRIAEAASTTDADIVVNVQGDEVLIHPETIDRAVDALLAEPGLRMSTVCHRLSDPALIQDPNVVKVVRDESGRALYFSRSPIPYDRSGTESAEYWQHVGLYAYRKEFLLQFAHWAPTPLEQAERLEQLRALERGVDIAVVETPHESLGVDTPEDLREAERRLEANRATSAG